MADRPIIIAVDFDGCLCENAWPEIGEARSDIIHALLERQKQGAKIILWTCRVGEHLAAAVQWCADHGITFDAVNDNLPSNIAAFGNDCRKIYADEYWDDKAVPTGPMIYICPNDGTVETVSSSRVAPIKGNEYTLNMNGVILDVLKLAGSCMDKMRSRGFQEKESWLCARISNALYMLSLCISKINQSEDEGWREEAEKVFSGCALHLYRACDSYLSKGDEDVMEGIVEGMRAIHSFQMAKNILDLYLKQVQSDNESSTS